MIKKRETILFISHDSDLHGATRSMLDIADGIRGYYDTFVFLPTKGRAQIVLNERHIKYKTIPYPILISYGRPLSFRTQIRKLYYAVKNLPRIIREAKKVNPSVVYVNSSVNYWMLILALFIRRPFVLHLREFGKEDHNIYTFFNGKLFSYLKKFARQIIANSISVQTYFKAHFQVDSTVIYNGVLATKDFENNLQQRRQFLQNTKVDNIIRLGIVGNIAPGKGQFEVIQAFHQIAKSDSLIHLYIIGGGKLENITAYIRNHNLENRITITGFVEDVTSYYEMLDIAIVNSRMEAFGRVTIEAASFAIPVIGRRSGATPELIEDYKTGILYDGSIEELTLKMRLLIQDKTLREDIGNAAWNNSIKRFNLEESINKIQCLINNLLVNY